MKNKPTLKKWINTKNIADNYFVTLQKVNTLIQTKVSIRKFLEKKSNICTKISSDYRLTNYMTDLEINNFETFISSLKLQGISFNVERFTIITKQWPTQWLTNNFVSNF